MTDLTTPRRRAISPKTILVIFVVVEAIAIFGSLAAPYLRSHWP